MIGEGCAERTLSDEKVRGIVAASAEAMAPDGKRVLVIVPDRTRTCPLPMMARALHQALAPRAAKLDFLIALGTHPPLEQDQINGLFGVEGGAWEDVFGRSRALNHNWQDKDALTHIGEISEDEIDRLGGGEFSRFRTSVAVTVNRLIRDYDCLLICGPVFPHEVVGFSGGNKYFFPGICGAELLDLFHWLGAVITSPRIIGTMHTPVRAVIDRAAAMIDVEKFALCMVVEGSGLSGLYFDTPEKAWAAAAGLSARVHVTYLDRPYESILAAAPEMYDDIWTAGKCMYKMEPVVADGGELIIYAPHITEISYTHGKTIEEIGYHTRDYFLAQWDRFSHYPWGVVAHSTHVRGVGTFEGGVEQARIQVTLATGIPESRCRTVNLGYRDPATIDPAAWQGKEGQGRLYVPKAGEMLYKLTDPPAWQTFQP